FVMDFGLARQVETPGMTKAGMCIGTPSYMSPEQAKGEQNIDPRSDVYSIGATLYEILTGRLPFEGDSSIGILIKVIKQAPPSLRQINPNLPEDLEIIVLRCMEKDPKRRYQTAREVADELRRYLEGEPVLARRATWAYRAGKKIRKHPLLSGVIAISSV